MNLLIIGHGQTINHVENVLTKSYHEIRFKTMQFYVDRPQEMAEKIKKQEKDFDCLLFTGKIPYVLSLDYLTPTVPWRYIVRRQRQIYSALLKAAVCMHDDLRRVSIDNASLVSFSPRTVESIYANLGVSTENLRFVEASIYDKTGISTIIDTHKRNIQAGCTFCLTGVSPVYDALQREGIPSIKMQFDDESVADAINELRLANYSRKEDAIMMAMFSIQTPRENMSGVTRQRKLLHDKMRITDSVLTLSNELGGALIECGNDQYCLVTQTTVVPNDASVLFTDVLRTGQQREISVRIGVGVDKDPCDARHFALRALQMSEENRGNCAFIVSGADQIFGPILPESHKNTEDIVYDDDMLAHIARIRDVPAAQLKKLIELREQKGNIFTSQDIAASLQISPRSANRLVGQLEERGIIKEAGKQLRATAGRPCRIFRLTL